MFVFYVMAAVLTVLFVFDSPAVDYRFVALGGVVPLLEGLTGRPLVLHTLAGSVGLMALVMGATTGRRIVRRRWLGVPIGTFVFLVASGVWTRSDLFWWPAQGVDAIGRRPLPEFDRPIGVLMLLEGLAWSGPCGCIAGSTSAEQITVPCWGAPVGPCATGEG
ncbi:MAG: hypothetical protein R2695_15700 [Acidimicrobiales bacterium]